jgi:hypothetical protein
VNEKVLIVEDEEKIARFVEMELSYEGYRVEKAFDGRTGLELALSGIFDILYTHPLRWFRLHSQTPTPSPAMFPWTIQFLCSPADTAAGQTPFSSTPQEYR